MKRLKKIIQPISDGRKKAYRISIYIIVPFIFAGISIISFLVAYDISDYYRIHDSAIQRALIPWVVIMGILSFLCGFVIIRFVLKPVKKFVEETQELPLFRDVVVEDRMSGGFDEIDNFDFVFTEVKNILSKVQARQLFPEIIGESKVMRAIFNHVLKVAQTDATVLIVGESGTGKELIAEGIVKNSLRKEKPFVKLSCVAIPEGLLESELFGHEKGAYTGAVEAKKGKFELAEGGTVFLDEIGDMSMATQAKLLRVLQDRTFEHVGGTVPITVDVRFIAATNKDLPGLIKEGRFREDLYYRLNVFSIALPPLRERRKDIPLLIEHFLEEAPRKVSLSQEALERMMAYGWPGNVRELRNMIERASVVADGDTIAAEELPAGISSYSMPSGGWDTQHSLDQRVAEIEKRMIVNALIQSQGIQVKAAALLGIKERSLWHRIKKYDIDVKRLDEQ